jgi:hypothetical protein
MGCINNPVNGPARLSRQLVWTPSQENHNNSALLQTKTILNAKKTNIHIDNLPKNLILISSILFIVLNIIVKSN